MILETTNYLLDYFVSSYSISIIRSPSSAWFSSSVALTHLYFEFESTSSSDPSGADEELNPGFGLRAKGCVLRSQALEAAGRMLIFIQD